LLTKSKGKNEQTGVWKESIWNSEGNVILKESLGF